MDRIRLLLTNVDACLAELKKFCDEYYESKILAIGYRTVPSFFAAHDIFQSTNIIQQTTDDVAIQSPRFFKPSSHFDAVKLMTQDDSQLAVASCKRSYNQ
jgi:hypothetical protein